MHFLGEMLSQYLGVEVQCEAFGERFSKFFGVGVPGVQSLGRQDLWGLGVLGCQARARPFSLQLHMGAMCSALLNCPFIYPAGTWDHLAARRTPLPHCDSGSLHYTQDFSALCCLGSLVDPQDCEMCTGSVHVAMGLSGGLLWNCCAEGFGCCCDL